MVGKEWGVCGWEGMGEGRVMCGKGREVVCMREGAPLMCGGKGVCVVGKERWREGICVVGVGRVYEWGRGRIRGGEGEGVCFERRALYGGEGDGEGKMCCGRGGCMCGEYVLKKKGGVIVGIWR